MLRRGSGAIINVASLLALSGTIPPDPPQAVRKLGNGLHMAAQSENICDFFLSVRL
jgi:hypothetical protein